MSKHTERIEEVIEDKTAQVFTQSELAFFQEKIEPVFVDICYKCHSADAEKLKADLYLDSRVGMLVGWENGPAITPEDPDDGCPSLHWHR